MDVLTQMIKTEIKNQFKTVRNFSQQIGIPQTTISSILKNGVGGTGYETIIKICRTLNIQLVNYEMPIHIDETAIKIINAYNALDEKGKHTVKAIIMVESERCKNGESEHNF